MMIRHPFVLLPLLASLAGCAGEASHVEAGEVVAPAAARTDAEALLALVPATQPSDPAERAAREALAMGAPWRAAVALAPALADPARRTPSVVLLAAAAAAEREEWATVSRLVAPLPDSIGVGFAPLLAARAALARGSGATADARTTLARQAYDLAQRSAARAPNAAERGVRLTLAARALDRLAAERRDAPLADSARAAYQAAATLLPTVGDWIALRAAAITRDSAARARLLTAITLAAARERSAAVEADALERLGDRSGAAAVYAAIGRRVKALSLRLADAGATDAVRTAIRDSLVRIVGAHSGTSEARLAVELLDTSFGREALTPAEELAVARSAAASGPASRATSGYARALAAGLGTPRDRYRYATLLARTGRSTDALAEFARVRAAGGALAGDAAYQRARLLLRARSSDAVAALEAVVATYPTDTAAATSALYLLADAAIDAGRDADARAMLLRLARQWPASDRAPRARLDAAIISVAGGDAATAARELDALRGGPRGIDSTSGAVAVAAAYWGGRAAAAAGDTARARARWREVATRVPASYYAMLAARRLGERPWAPVGSEVPPSPPAGAARDIASATARMTLLERIGFDPEAGWERDALVRSATSARAEAGASNARTLAVAEALRDAGATSSAMRLARRALDDGAEPTVAAYRVLYPWPWASLLRESARARNVDPALAAAVIRQESSFTPSATSPVGAVGLMQLMPPVGRALWNALGAARADVPWSPALLRQPDVNVALGTRHLATSLGRYPDVAYALAAYNAGGTPVARWRTRRGADDPELFVERIPYEETRDYVRIVLRNRAFYEQLYGR